MEFNSIILENGIEYIVIAETNIAKTKYYLLSNPNDKYDYAFRKEKDDELIGLDNKDEYSLVAAKFFSDNRNNPYLMSFCIKYKEILEKNNKN